MNDVVVAPYLCVTPAIDAVAFYRAAFGAVEESRQTVPDGSLSHCRMRIGNARFYLADEFPPTGWKSPPALDGHSVGIQLEVDNPDQLMERALGAGATLDRELKEDDYGRWGIVVDPFGHYWTIINPNENFGAENVPQ
jgi:PhnB protein